jgi:hypothetical protein
LNDITFLKKFMKIYQAVHTLLVRDTQTHFGMIMVTFSVITSTQNVIQIDQSVQKLHHLRSLNIRHSGVIDVTFNVITPRTKFHQNSTVSSNVVRGFLCTHLRSLNVRHFGMVEGTGLENMASRPSPTYNISSKSTNGFKRCTISPSMASPTY